MIVWAMVLLWVNAYTGDIDISLVTLHPTHDDCWAELMVYKENLAPLPDADCVQVEIPGWLRSN